jgi:hypothetical protein
MNRYQPYFTEAVINPDKYISNNIQPLINKTANAIYDSKNMQSICKKLNFLFSKLNIEFKNLKDVSPIGILHAPATNNKKKTITIYLSDNLLNVRQTKDMRFFFLELKAKLSHELIRRGQFIKADTLDLKGYAANDNELSYMKDRHEIMAYAFNTIEYFRIIGIRDEQLKSYIKQKHPLLNSCFFYTQYANNFTKEDKELKLYYKYIYMYLDNQAKDI